MEKWEEYNALIEQGKHDEAEKLRSEALKEAAQYMKNRLSVDEAIVLMYSIRLTLDFPPLPEKPC
ncbi:hypothetical protein EZS27_038575 [termite gut metagenome]|uniref:Uncharacterized protein n=1 Tax=termite gut metagenome TaxID=433724 RepID=A0A5J4PLF1_9ZZZZ